MRKLLITGAGGHGKVVAEVAQSMGCWEMIAYLDDRHHELSMYSSLPIIGSLNDAEKFISEYGDLAVAIGDNSLRLELVNKYQEMGFNLPILIQSGTWVSPTAKIGDGSVIFAQTAINADANIGRGCIINTGATVDHDCIIQDGVHVCPGAHLGGGVKIGHHSFIGIGVNIIQQIEIGENVIIGAGSVVISNIENNKNFVGIPARELQDK